MTGTEGQTMHLSYVSTLFSLSNRINDMHRNQALSAFYQTKVQCGVMKRRSDTILKRPVVKNYSRNHTKDIHHQDFMAVISRRPFI